MISRRTILAWLGLAPIVAATSSFPASEAVVRTRKAGRWATILQPDGSVALARGDERYLTSWLQVQDREAWAAHDKRSIDEVLAKLNPNDTLGYLDEQIKADAEAVKERANPWRDLEQFEKETGIEVPVESKVYAPGTHFVQDFGGSIEENRRRWETNGLMEKNGPIVESWMPNPSYRSKFTADALAAEYDRNLDWNSLVFYNFPEIPPTEWVRPL